MRRSQLSVRGALGAAVLLLVLFVLPAGALALEPPRPGELDRYAKDGSLAQREAFAKSLGNNRVSPAVMKRLKTQQFFSQVGAAGAVYLPPPAWRGMPTTGNVKVLTLLIDFSDWPAQNTAGTIDTKLFGAGTTAGDFPYESLKNFYQRSSYDQLTIGGNVLGWYRPGYARSAVARTDTGRETLIKEALNHFNTAGAGHDFSQYDNDGDGVIDYFVVIWAGPDNGWANFWWGYQTSFGDSSYKLDGKSLKTYSWQWECRYSGGVPIDGVYDQLVVIHETGHALGLPDYYDYKSTADGDLVGPDGGVGGLDMMDSNWGDHNGFSKWMLGWLSPQVVTTAPHSVALAASGTSPAAMVIMPGATPGDPFNEFFMVQNRQRVGNDSDCTSWPSQNLPGDGLVVWHVDARLNGGGTDFVWDNSYTSHKLLRLMEADGLEQIEISSAWADAGDYYTSGDSIGDASAPNSKKYDTTSSDVSVSGIPAASGSMTFTAGIVGAAPPGSDVTAPVTAYSGVVDGGVYRTDISVQLDATDGIGGSGVASITGIVNGGTPAVIAGTQAFLNVLADPTHANDDTYQLSYYAADVASNFETPKSVTVTMDTYGPVTKAPYSARVKRLRAVKLNFKVLDPVFGTNLARPGTKTRTVTLKIRNRSGRVVKAVTWRASAGAALDIGVLYYWKYVAKQAKGTYRVSIYAQDEAGNNQRSVGSNKLVIY